MVNMSTSNVPSRDDAMQPVPQPAHYGASADYERTDASVPAVLAAGVGLMIGLVLIMSASWYLFKYLRNEARNDVADVSPVAQTENLSQTPRLQTWALQDYHQFAAAQHTILNQYSIQDHRTKSIRIPIERALELIVERGPAATDPQPKVE